MAVLEALASSVGCTLSELLIGHGLNSRSSEISNGSLDKKDAFRTQICALLESEGTPKQVADEAANLVKQGFCTLKLKVSYDSFLTFHPCNSDGYRKLKR